MNAIDWLKAKLELIIVDRPAQPVHPANVSIVFWFVAVRCLVD